MKNFILIGAIALSIVANCCISAAGNEEADLIAWNDYKSKFMKNYTNEEEDKYRMKIFLENRHYLSSYGIKSTHTFTQGLNHLSDWTTEEVNSKLNGFRLNVSDDSEWQSNVSLLETILLSLNSSMAHSIDERNQFEGLDKAWYDQFIGPASLDFRTSGRVSKVKDQGSCGSCWSFATTGALESILASRGRKVLLSEQNLVDCSRRYGNYGCNGGLMDAALRYVHDHGIMSQADYPYTAKDEDCKFSPEKSVTSVRGSLTLPRGNEALLRLALALTGPIPVAIDAGQKSFHSYKSGVYNDRACHSSANRLNHAVLLVGYGSDRNAGGDYWIIKNSWSSSWGDNGYIKMARNQGNMCGIATFAVLPLP